MPEDFKTTTVASLKKMTLDELMTFTAMQQPDHWTRSAGMTEFTYRQTDWQINAAEAQIQAARSEGEAAQAATIAAQAETESAQAALRSTTAAEKNAIYRGRALCRFRLASLGCITNEHHQRLQLLCRRCRIPALHCRQNMLILRNSYFV
jgi:hypothetical protein